MFEGEVGTYEKRDIDAQIARILRDLGNPTPPLKLADVRSLLKIDLRYYRSTDPGLLSELTHRFNLLARKTLPDIGRHLATALAKSKLNAFWIPSNQRILLDETVPKLKHRWLEAHEISHSVTSWHKDYLLGDNKHTVDPECHAIIEAEANYGAGALLFMAGRFTEEARDLPSTFESIKSLSGRYGNTIVSTLWRMVEYRDPHLATFAMVSIHPIFPEIGAHDGPDPWRYFIRSPAFRLQFPNVSPATAYDFLCNNASARKKGPIFETSDVLQNAIGETWEFNIECFSNSYAVLTLGTALAKRGAQIQV